MFYLHTSNQTEQLSEQLGDILQSGSSPSLFSPELFLIQSRGMERMLAQYLADRFGVWSNSRYLLPLQFLDYLGGVLGFEQDWHAFDRDILTWRLERILRDLSGKPLEQLKPYLQGDRSDLKRYQLARNLADIFDQYQLMRPDYLESWQDHRRVSSDDSELWQRYLWQRLREDAPLEKDRGEVIHLLNQALQERSSVEKLLFERIFVFGVHTMPRPFLAIIRELSRNTDVYMFLLSPCAGYWGDLQTGRKAALQRLQDGDGQHPKSFLGTPQTHPLLASLGRQGADFQDLLLTMIDRYQDGPESFKDPVEEGETSVLNHLQSGLLNGMSTESPERSGLANDDSIMIVSCHSRMREIEVLKDHILDWLHHDQDLDLNDIIVMAPNIQDYAQLIPALFADFQYDISDRFSRRTNKYFDCFLQFLQMFSGRYGWGEIISLFERPEICKRYQLSGSDLERLRYLVIGSGIRWGLSAEQKQLDGLPPESAGTWRAGLERMLMGLAVDSEEEVVSTIPFVGVEISQCELLGKLYEFVEMIETTSIQCRSSHSLSEWGVLFRSFCSALYLEENQPELDELYRLFSQLTDDFSLYHTEPLTFDVARSWLEACSQTCSSGGFLSGRLTFCSMLPMRSIPFKNICLIGLNESDYPKKDEHGSFDLLGLTYRPGDRSQRADDRYQMLEAILAARHRLYLSYVGQSLRMNSRVPPSVIVTEILETLQDDYGLSDITVHHPLHSFNKKYFSDATNLFSYSKYDCGVAEAMLAVPEDSPSQWLNGEVALSESEEIDLSELESFVTGPQAYFVRNVMGIQLSRYELYPDQHELFEADGLQGYFTDQKIVRDLLAGISEDHILKVLQANQEWPLGVPGQLLFADKINEISGFVGKVKPLATRGKLPGKPIRLHSKSIQLSGSIDQCYPDGVLFFRYANVKGRDLMRGWFLHLAANLGLEEPYTTRIIGRNESISIAPGIGTTEDLDALVELFLDGSRFPSPFHVEPAYEYAKQVIRNRGSGRKPPILSARDALRKELDNNYQPEKSLLFPDLDVEHLLDEAFERLALTIMLPLLDSLNRETDGDGNG